MRPRKQTRTKKYQLRPPKRKKRSKRKHVRKTSRKRSTWPLRRPRRVRSSNTPPPLAPKYSYPFSLFLFLTSPPPRDPAIHHQHCFARCPVAREVPERRTRRDHRLVERVPRPGVALPPAVLVPALVLRAGPGETERRGIPAVELEFSQADQHGPDLVELRHPGVGGRNRVPEGGTDLGGGQDDLSIDQGSNSISQVGAGTIRAYAVSDDKRVESAADVPTVEEDGSAVGVVEDAQRNYEASLAEKASALARECLGRTFEQKVLGCAESDEITAPWNRHVTGLPAGVLARALGLGGGSYALEAACASSLTRAWQRCAIARPHGWPVRFSQTSKAARASLA